MTDYSFFENTVRVIHFQSQGTGFFIKSDLIISCAHVIGNNISIGLEVEFYSVKHSRTGKAKVIDFNLESDIDVVFLKVITFKSNINNSLLYNINLILPMIGECLITFGYTKNYPNGESVSFESEGISYTNKSSLLKLKGGQAQEGLSGAPLLYKSNNSLCGIICISRNVNTDLGARAIPIDMIYQLYDKYFNKINCVTNNSLSYLGNLYEYCQNLPYLSLHAIQPHKTLKEIFVNLKAVERRRKHLKNDDKINDIHEKEHSIRSDQMLNQTGRYPIIIIGEPGSGKSTLLRHFAINAYIDFKHIGLDKRHLPILIQLPKLAKLSGNIINRFNDETFDTLGYKVIIDSNGLLHNEMNIPFLFLLDSLDEVPETSKPQLLELLNLLIYNNKNNKFIITSRPTGYYLGSIKHKELKEYQLLPFSESQAKHFSKLWFPSKYTHFLKEFSISCPIELRGTPLLLTIAAKVYSTQGMLPKSKSILYDKFIDIWLDEAVLKDLKSELNQSFSTNILKQLLSEVAVGITMMTFSSSKTTLKHLLKISLENNFNYSPSIAEAISNDFLKIMSRRSGIFTINDNNYVFLHPTFREYLFAYNMVVKNDFSIKNIFSEILSFGLTGTWREIAIFALCILGDNQIDVSNQLILLFNNSSQKYYKDKKIPYEDDEQYQVILFISSAIASGLCVSNELHNKIITYFRDLIYTFQEEDESPEILGEYNPIKVLGSIRSDESIKVLSDILHSKQAFGINRFLCFEMLIEIGMDNSELNVFIDICLGKDRLYHDDEVNFVARWELIDILKEKGFVTYSNYFSIVYLRDLLESDSLYPDEINSYASGLLQNINYNESDQKDIKEIFRTSIESNTYMINKCIKLIEDYDPNLLTLKLLEFIDKKAIKNELDLEWLFILMGSNFINDKKIIDRITKIVFDSGINDWYRVSCFEMLVKYTSVKLNVKKLVSYNAEDYDTSNYSYIEDSYARHYLKEKYF
jgi:hypothetical protein